MTPDSITSAADERLKAAPLETATGVASLSCLMLAPAGAIAWEDRERQRLMFQLLNDADGGARTRPFGFNDVGLRGAFRHPVRTIMDIRELSRKLPLANSVLLPIAPTMPLLEQLAAPLVTACYFGRRVIIDLRHRFAEMQLESTGRTGYWLLGRAERVLVSTDQLAAGLRRRGIHAAAVTPAVDTERVIPRVIERVQPRILANLGASDDQDSPPIGWRCLVEGFEQIKAKYPRAELTVLIDGVSGSELAADNADLPPGISLRPATDDAVVDRCFAQADCFVNPIAVGNPIGAVLHAMARGLPVLSTKVGAIPEIINDRRNGIFVSPNHPAVLAQRVIDLIESPELVTQLSLRAALTARCYGWSEVRKQWSHVLFS